VAVCLDSGCILDTYDIRHSKRIYDNKDMTTIRHFELNHFLSFSLLGSRCRLSFLCLSWGCRMSYVSDEVEKEDTAWLSSFATLSRVVSDDWDSSDSEKRAYNRQEMGAGYDLKHRSRNSALRVVG